MWWTIARGPGETYESVATKILSVNNRRLSHCDDLNTVLKITSLSRFIALLPPDTASYVKTSKPADIREAARLAADHEDMKQGSGLRRQPWQHWQDSRPSAYSYRQRPSNDGSNHLDRFGSLQGSHGYGRGSGNGKPASPNSPDMLRSEPQGHGQGRGRYEQQAQGRPNVVCF